MLLLFSSNLSSNWSRFYNSNINEMRESEIGLKGSRSDLKTFEVTLMRVLSSLRCGVFYCVCAVLYSLFIHSWTLLNGLTCQTHSSTNTKDLLFLKWLSHDLSARIYFRPWILNTGCLCKVTYALPKDLSLDFQTLKTNLNMLSAEQCQ